MGAQPRRREFTFGGDSGAGRPGAGMGVGQGASADPTQSNKTRLNGPPSRVGHPSTSASNNRSRFFSEAPDVSPLRMRW
jgi:hypothetical protein